MARIMKITQVMLNKKFGGVERIVVDMCIGLAARGHKVQAIVDKDFTHQYLLDHENIEITPIAILSRHDPFAKRRVKKVLKQFNPDVVHIHLRKGIAIALNSCRKLNLKTCTSMHNYGRAKIYDGVDRICVPTKAIEHHMISEGINRDKLRFIPNFSKMENIYQPNTIKPVVNLFSFGRFVHKKGFDILIEAIALIKHPALPFHLYIAGAGEERESLTTRIKQYDLSDQVSVIPWVDDVQDFIDRNDVFILPSREEPFGLVVLEAMARGKLIIAHNNQGPAELLNEDSAYLYSPNSPQKLASEIEKALIDMVNIPNFIFHKQRLALQNYTEHYSEPLVIPALETQYRTI